MDDNRSKGFFLPKTISAFGSCHKILLNTLSFYIYCRAMVQFFQLQAALHVIPGKCSTIYSAWGAIEFGCVWLSCLIFHFGKCIYGLQTGLLLRITLFIPFLAQTVDIWTWLHLLCLLYACYFNLQTCNGIVSICFIREPSWTTF